MSYTKRRQNINPSTPPIGATSTIGANLNIDDRIIEVLNANRDEVIDFANWYEYTHTNDINTIPVNRQFYEVNLNNNMISREKKRKHDNDNYIESTKPHFIITDKILNHDSIVNWASDRSKKQRGGKRTRMRKSSKKRRTTKRR
jgi:hypothetical protein